MPAALLPGESLLPARAGMILGLSANSALQLTAPRTRGDDPYGRFYADLVGDCSPHARG